jgi:hypothetical protein
LTAAARIFDDAARRSTMLLLHEVHEVAGRHEGEFEAAFREGWLPTLAETDDSRLLYFLHHAHGTGVSYNVVTLTLLRDTASWESLSARVHGGDLAKWAAEVDRLRHEVTSKLLVPLPWSPIQEITIADVPVSAGAHDPVVYMEDTVWPYEGSLEQYIQRSGAHYAKEIAEHAREGTSILQVEAGFRTAFGTGRRREIVLWQRVVQPKALSALVSREVPARFKQPGGWMHDALDLRDRWESKLLRTAPWSPLPSR